MKVVSPNVLKKVNFTGEYGGFANIFTADLDKKTYCYKLFREMYDLDIIDNLAYMTDIEFSDEFLTPLYLVGKESKFLFTGCLSNWVDAIDLGFVCDKKYLIRYLKMGRDIVQKLHNEYQYIHGDISEANIIVNTDEDKVYLCDFDSALRFNQDVVNTNYFSYEVYDYLKYHKFDKMVDVFCYNLLTLKLLLKLEDNTFVFEKIIDGSDEVLNLNSDVKRLSKELIYDENKISGEFIVDYIDWNMA